MKNAFELISKEKSVSFIHEEMKKIPLTTGFDEIFKFLRENKNFFEPVIISNANTLSINMILDHYQIDNFQHIYTNKGYVDERGLFTVEPYHEFDCQLCSPNLCKGDVLKNHLSKSEIERVVYIGDGANDFCPSYFLSDKDYVAAR